MKEILITSSVLIPALLALRMIFRKSISRRVQYALWGLVLLRLLVPVNLPGVNFSVLSAAEPVRKTVETRLENQMVYAFPTEVYPSTLKPGERPVIDRTVHSFYNPEGSEREEFYSGGVVIDQEAATHYFFMMPTGEILLYIWYGGMAVMACWLLISNLRFWYKLRKAKKPYIISDCKCPVFLVKEGLPSPCLFGLFRPTVYLTSAAIETPEKLRHVIAHETTHARHMDPLWSLLRGVCLVIYWFNPLVWIAAFVSKTDCELACDEGALKQLGETERIPYGQTLLSLIPVRKSPSNPLLSATTMTSDKKRLTDRITRIAENRQTVAAALFLAVAAVLLVCAVTFTGASEPNAPDSPGISASVTDAPLVIGIAAPPPIRGTALTGEELLYFNNQFFNGGDQGLSYVNIRNQFLSSLYASPEEIDLFELFYCGLGSEGAGWIGPYSDDMHIGAEERQAVVDQGYEGFDPQIDLTKVMVPIMDSKLLQNTGLTLAETNQVGLERFTYLEEYGAYYHFHGDTNYRYNVYITAGEREGNLVRLYYNDTFMGDGWKCVTLREGCEGGYGGYWFVSNLPVEGQPVIATVYPEKAPVLTISLAGLAPSEPQKIEVTHRSNDCAERLDGWAVEIGEDQDLLVRTYRSTDGNVYAAVIQEEVLEGGSHIAADCFLTFPENEYTMDSITFFDALFGHNGCVISYDTDNGLVHEYYTFSMEGVPSLLARTYGVDSQILDLNGDGNNELLSSGGSGSQLWFQRDGQIYCVELSSLLYDNWPEMNWWDYSSIDASRRCLTVSGFVDMPEWDKDYLEGAHTSAYFLRSLYFDGENLLVYDDLKDTLDNVAVGAVGMSVSPAVLTDAKFLAQGAYLSTKQGDENALTDQGYDDWRVSRLSLVDRYGDYGITTEVYSLSYEFHASEPGKIGWAGGMYVDENGWVGGFYPDSPYLVYWVRENGGYSRLESSIPYDVSPDAPLFQAALARTLMTNGLISPADVSGEDLSLMLYDSGGIGFFNLLAEYPDDQLYPALQNLADWYNSADKNRTYRVDDPLQNIFWNDTGLTEKGGRAYRLFLPMLQSSMSEAAQTARTVMDAIIADGKVTMDYSPSDGVGGGAYTVDVHAGNGPNRVNNFPGSFQWYIPYGDTSNVPDSSDALKIQSSDGSASFLCWPRGIYVHCTLNGEAFWLMAVPKTDSTFDDSLFSFFRFWYDEAEWAALRPDIAIPNQGQSHLEIAQEWVDRKVETALKVTPGSKYACTYVRAVASVDQWTDMPESAYPAWTEGRERFYFSYDRVFVPENEAAMNWNMAGNTGDYDGSLGEAPDGALINFQIGPMYLADDGWRCEGTGTGP